MYIPVLRDKKTREEPETDVEAEDQRSKQLCSSFCAVSFTLCLPFVKGKKSLVLKNMLVSFSILAITLTIGIFPCKYSNLLYLLCLSQLLIYFALQKHNQPILK